MYLAPLKTVSSSNPSNSNSTPSSKGKSRSSSKQSTNSTNNNNTGGTGSYTNTHKSGKKYHGKGDRGRAAESAKEKADFYNDPVVSTDWTPAPSEREAFKQENARLEADGGHRSPTNYNKRASPGKDMKQRIRRKLRKCTTNTAITCFSISPHSTTTNKQTPVI